MTDQANAPIDALTGYGMRTWYTPGGGLEVFEIDLPVCCRKAARGDKAPFECPGCFMRWEINSKSQQRLIKGIRSALRLIANGTPACAHIALEQALEDIGELP